MRDFSSALSRQPLETLLVEHSKIDRCVLKNRLVSVGLLIYRCALCGINEWMGKKLILRLDHINGINDDYRFENLRLLCPNCDSQTEFYCGKNRKVKPRPICSCGKVMYWGSPRCIDCTRKMPKQSWFRCKINWPQPEVVQQMVRESSYTAVGKILGVSDCAIHDFLENTT